MKLVLCTLAICLSVLASVCTLSTLVRTESKKVRSSVTKALTEPLNPAAREESVIQKLDALNSQLTSLNRRLSLLEEGVGRSSRAAAIASAEPADTGQTEIRALTKNVNTIGTAVARLEGVPSLLTALTTYIDRSFGHLEKTVSDAAAPQDLLTPLNRMAVKIDNIDSYFTPLYAFLGLTYDPANQDLIAMYPSIDERVNDLFVRIEAVRKEVAEIHYMITPHMIEPKKHQD